MKRYGARGALNDPPQLGEWVVVLAADAEAAIAKITAVAFEQILGADDDLDQAIKEAYLLGQADMLAKCIAAVEAVHSPIRIDDDLSYCRGCADAAYEEYSYAWPCAVVIAIRALQDKP